MSQASTVRPARPGRALLRRHRLLTGVTMMVLLGAPAAFAQQYGSVGSSVTVDYGVLDSLGGAGGPNLPGMLATGQPQAAPYSANPYGGTPYAGQGTLLQPPAATPHSGLTAPGTATAAAAATAGSTGGIQLIPPSEFKKKTVAAPPPKPAPAPQPTPEPTKQAAVEPTPPPPPTEIQAPATPTPPSPPAATDAAPATASAAPATASATPATPAVPAPEPPAMAQTTPEPPPAPASELFPETSQQAAAEPPPPPAPEPAPEPVPEPAAAPEPAPAAPAAESGSSSATGGEDSSAAAAAPVESDVDDVPPAPDGEATPDGMGIAEETGTGETGGEETQTAALPAPAMVEGQVSVTFADGASELTPEGKSALDTVAERLRSDESLRVQLLAYAQATDDNTSRARRMSLSRALAVRSYLIEKGVRSTRMDVRALGNNVEGEPADRVDIIPQAQ